MRLIDADWVLAALGVFNDRKHGDAHFFNGIASAEEIVEHAPTIATRDWTPCAEGLPENNKPCYVTVKKTWDNGTSNLYVLDGYYAKGSWFDKGGWKINSHGAYPWDCDAIAWKLNVAPEPYRADDTTGKVDHIRDATKKIHELKSPEQCTFRVRSVKDGHGDTERGNDWCNGYQKSEVDDEPCLTCQACKLCAANDQEED